MRSLHSLAMKHKHSYETLTQGEAMYERTAERIAERLARNIVKKIAEQLDDDLTIQQAMEIIVIIKAEILAEIGGKA